MQFSSFSTRPCRSWQTLDLSSPLRSFPSPATYSWTFPHANFSAATLKQDLVHRRPHQADAMRVPKLRPHKLLRAVGKRSRVLSRRQTLPACGHSRTSSVRTKLIIDGGAGNNGTDAAKTQNETVESHIRAWPGVFRLPRFPADVRGPCVGDRLCGKRLTCPYPMPPLEQGADAGARIRRVYRMLMQRTPPRTGKKTIV